MLVDQLIVGWLPRRRATNAKGFTILELVATLSLLLVLAVSAAGILRHVREIGELQRDSSRAREAVVRLAEKFSNDVRSTQVITVAPEGWPVQLADSNRTITYDWLPKTHRMTRTEQFVGDEGAARTARDSFLLDHRCQPRLQQMANNAELIRLVLRDKQGRLAPWVVEVAR